jgi:hypothetical protein
VVGFSRQLSSDCPQQPRLNDGAPMIRRALLLLAAAGIYMAIKRSRENATRPIEDKAADAQWANEGGANAPASV